MCLSTLTGSTSQLAAMSTVLRDHFRFPQRKGNRIRLLVDGDRFYAVMLQAIAGARQEILLEMYLVEAGMIAERFADALLQAAERGVSVRALLDDLGSRGLDAATRSRLSRAGVLLAVYNPLRAQRMRRNLHRDHRKLLLIDGTAAYVGGAGLADQFSAEITGEQYWHDVMIELRGPCAADWRDLFVDAWSRWSEPSRALPSMRPPPPAGDTKGRVTIGMGPRRQEIKRSLIGRVRKARHRVWLASAYFSPPRRLRRHMMRAARAGADVRLLLPGARTDHPLVWFAGRRYYGRLLRDGVRIFEYQPRFLHAKLYLCDDWVSVGSANLDHWTLHWNLEANQEMDDVEIAIEVADLFIRDFAESREITWVDWRSRGRVVRLLERMVGWLHAWITRTSYREAVRAKIEPRQRQP